MNQEIEQALEQLRQRIAELCDAKLAPPHELARDIDQLHVMWLSRYTTREGHDYASQR